VHKKNWVMTSSLLSLPYSEQKIEEKKRQRYGCVVTFFISSKNKKMKKIDGVFFF